MARFPSLPATPQLGDVFTRFPDGVGALLEYHDVMLRGPSPLSVAQRELLAAYVSALNACRYCMGAHTIIAEIHGVPPGVLESALADPSTPEVPRDMRPLLAYVRKLTEWPARMTDADAEAVYAIGWNEAALFHAISICALFNFMNRIVEGCGVTAHQEAMTGVWERHRGLKNDPQTYRAFGRRLGITR